MRAVFCGVLAFLLALPVVIAGEPTKVRVLIIDGQNNHNWRATTPVLRQALEKSGRFMVDVATAPAKLPVPKKPKDDNAAAQEKYKQELDKFRAAEPAYREQMEKFRPDLGKYDVVLSNYNGDAWSKVFQKDFDDAVSSGKLGLVVFHAANNSFSGWPEFNKMIGMGWRGNAFGERIYYDSDVKEVRVPKGKGPGAGETSMHPFRVAVRDSKHPITQGMPLEWMHTADQLVHGLRGPAEGVHMLATAYSDKGKGGTGEHELMMWTVTYGKGRIFHTPMGHDVGSVRCVGFLTAILRGTEWAATGKVTLPIPQNFPTPDKTSSSMEK